MMRVRTGATTHTCLQPLALARHVTHFNRATITAARVPQPSSHALSLSSRLHPLEMRLIVTAVISTDWKAMKFRLKFLFLLLVLTACAAPTPPREALLSEQATWTKCANEFATCEFSGMRQVRYGSSGRYVIKNYFGYVQCNKVNFNNTDPNPGQPKSCEVSSVLQTTTLKNPMPGMGPAAPTVNVPLGHPGYSGLRVATTTLQPGSSDGTGAFRIVCDYSHMNFDDPMVNPGKPGASHLHTFFGNKGTNAYSTATSLATIGKSTCHGGTANRSAYWVPTLLDAQGQPVVPAIAIIYYKTGYTDIPPSSIQAMPAGLRMIAGDKNSSSAQEHAHWDCPDNVIFTGHPSSIPAASACGGVGKHIQMTVVFPQCWDGKNLDSADHKSHMAYPTRDKNNKLVCPPSHPRAIPEISFNIRYKIPSTGTTGWRLASDMYSTTKPGGFSGHGDWFDGWNPAIRDMWIKNCDNAAKDCRADLLGLGSDGKYKTLY